MPLKILHAVEFYAPSVGGAQEVVRQVSERLAGRGHDVTVATSATSQRTFSALNGVAIAEFDVHGNAVRGMTGEIDRYRRFVCQGDFDVVMLYAAQEWAVDALLDVLDEIRAPTILAPCGFSGLHDPAYTEYFRTLRTTLPRFDALIFHSETYQDHRFAATTGAINRTVIPNAADASEFATASSGGRFRDAHNIALERPLLLSVGGHTGLKGHAESMAVLRKSRAATRGTLAIVGNSPTGSGCRRLCAARAAATRAAKPGRRVVLADPPRSAVVDAYYAADLFVFCSMIECSPLVLFEAMAAGLPFVSVDVGNAREIAAWSGGGLIAASRRRPDGLVEADVASVTSLVDALLEDADRREELGARGRRAWEARFTWEAVTTQYEDLYREVAA